MEMPPVFPRNRTKTEGIYLFASQKDIRVAPIYIKEKLIIILSTMPYPGKNAKKPAKKATVWKIHSKTITRIWLLACFRCSVDMERKAQVLLDDFS